MRHFLGQLGRRLVRLLVRLYYPRIEISGRGQIPRTGSILLVANHANSLLDPVIVGLSAGRPVRFLAKAPLFETPVLGWLLKALGMLPAYRAEDDRTLLRRNLDSLTRAAMALVRGDAVGVFPEGRSHEGLELQPIRSGAARMAVQAVQQGARELKLIPIGINYEDKQRFRSAIWVRVGRPITVARFLARYPDERHATRALTREIEVRLKKIVIHLSDPAQAPFLSELECLLPPRRKDGHPAISGLRQRKRLADAINFFHDREQKPGEVSPKSPSPGRQEASAADMAHEIRAYRAQLEAAGLNARSTVVRFRSWTLLGKLVAEAAWLAVSLPAAMAGALFHVVPFAIVRALGRWFQEGPTTTALSRLSLGLPIYGGFYAAAWWALRTYFLPWVAWTVVALMPLAGVLALAYAHRTRALCGYALDQFTALFRRNTLRALRSRQRLIREKLQQFVDEFNAISPSPADRPMPLAWKRVTKTALGWTAVSTAILAGLIALNWRLVEQRRESNPPGLNLAALTPAALDSSLRSDEAALGNMIAGLGELERSAQTMMVEFKSGQRDWYRQADNDAARAQLLTYLNYRTALLRIIWKYQNPAPVPEERLRLRAFLVSYTAASVLYEASLKFVTLFQNSAEAVRKLNEAEPLWDIPPGLYETVRHNLLNSRNQSLLREAQARYRAEREAFIRTALDRTPPHDRFHQAIATANGTMARLGEAVSAGLPAPLAEARHTARRELYEAQSLVSRWIGDTKVREPRGGHSLIAPGQVQELRSKLRPGDVLLERRNWFLSNAFLPGFWPHSALYVGGPDDLKVLGLDRDPRVQKHWPSYTRADAAGHLRVIIEAVSEGVVFTSIEHSVGEADSAAFLRPNLTEAQLKEAIARAFSHIGKPYDFEFDFFSTDKLVCSELVFRAYDGDIRFPLVNVMGRKTLPPIEIVRQCVRERIAGRPQFSFVAFLDGDERRGHAAFASEEVFYETVNRPGLTFLSLKR